QNRRQCLTKTASMTAAAWGISADKLGVAFSSTEDGGTGAALRPEDVLDQEKMRPRGKFVEATVPDTLDLAERARLSVNNLTHNVDPEDYYYVFQGFTFGPNAKGLSLSDRTLDIT